MLEKKRCNDRLNQDGGSQLVVDVVPAVLDGDHTAAPAAGDDRDGFAAVAAQRKQKRVQLLILGDDVPDDVFLAFQSVVEIHGTIPPFVKKLVGPNCRPNISIN